MTMNLTARYYASSRDFVVLDRDRADVAAVEATFANDWANGGLPPALAGRPRLEPRRPGCAGRPDRLGPPASCWSKTRRWPTSAVTHALRAAARRGVRVEVVMTRQRDWASAFSTLARGRGRGAHLHRLGAPLHPRQGDRRRPRHGARPGVRRLAELLGRLAALQPRAGPDHDPAGRSSPPSPPSSARRRRRSEVAPVETGQVRRVAARPGAAARPGNTPGQATRPNTAERA